MQLQLDRPAGTRCLRPWSVQLLKSLIFTNSLRGGAPIWAARALPVCVPADCGTHFIDQNSSKNPEHSFEVVFRAMSLMRPEYRFNEVDALVNRNTLRKLLDFCNGRGQSSFRIDLYTVNNTLIMERFEKYTKELLHGSHESGYGHNFERLFTQPAPHLTDSTAHHRVLKYDFGGLNLAVRFEADASCCKSGITTCSQTVEAIDDDRRDSASSLVSQLHSLRLSAVCSPAVAAGTRSVFALEGGGGSPQSSLMELKTNKKSINQIMPQLWFGRTPYLVRGRHKRGEFETVEISMEADNFKTWETNESNQRSLCKMVSLISQIRDIVAQVEGNAAVMVFQKDQPEQLEIFARKVKRSPLPFDTMRKFWT